MKRIAAALSLTIALFGAIPDATAAEVQWEGFYRARGRAFDTLSLQRDLANSEGLSTYVQHRLWLRPRFVLSEKAAVFVEFRGLDGVTWGDEPAPYFDPVAGTDIASVYSDSLGAPSVTLTTGERAGASQLDFTLWRAWGEVHTDYGRFSAGRMPMHWGQGIWLNDGTTDDDGFRDHGDTADRIKWEHLVDDTVYVMAAFDVNSEGFINLDDDTLSVNLGAAYRTESIVAGLYAQYRTRPTDSLNLVTFDANFDAQLGNIELHAEILGQFGSGDFDNGLNDVRVSAGGGVVQFVLGGSKNRLEALVGAATGDGDTSDAAVHTFAFDRDYNVGLFMFEQPMPVLSTGGTGTGRSYEITQTGPAISNAFFLKPKVSREFFDNFEAGASVLIARTVVTPEELGDRVGYGQEIDLHVMYEPYEHVEIQGTFGVFLPGTWYRNYDTDNFDLSDPAFGGQVVTAIRF